MSSDAARARRAKQMQQWEATRALGKRRYVLVQGLATYGGAMFFAMGVVSPLMRQGVAGLTPVTLAISAVAWSLGGVIFGAVTWSFMERAYRKYIAEQEKVSG